MNKIPFFRLCLTVLSVTSHHDFLCAKSLTPFFTRLIEQLGRTSVCFVKNCAVCSLTPTRQMSSSGD